MTFIQAEGPATMTLAGYLPLLLVFAAFYFFLIRPQQKQQRQRREMLSQLNKGDKIVTVGGIHGEITAIDDDVVVVRIADKTEVKMSRAGIGRVREKDD